MLNKLKDSILYLQISKTVYKKVFYSRRREVDNFSYLKILYYICKWENEAIYKNDNWSKNSISYLQISK